MQGIAFRSSILHILVALLATSASCVSYKSKAVESVHRQFHEDGSPRVEMQTLGGLPHGKATRWHPSGAVAHRGQFVHGDRDGVFEYWDAKGRWIRAEYFIEDTKVWMSTVQGEEPPSRSLLMAEIPVVSQSGLDAWLEGEGRIWPTGFPMMPSSSNRQQLSLGYAAQSVETAGGNLSLRRQRLFAAMPIPGQSFGVYGKFARTSATDSMDTTTSGRATAELGLRWQRPKAPIAARFGLGAPTGNDDIEGHLVAVRSAQVDINEVVAVYPRSMSMRGSVSYKGHKGRIYYMADSGLDVAIDTFGDQSFAMRDGFAVLSRTALGLGVSTKYVGCTVNVGGLYPLRGAGIDDGRLSLAASVQLRSRWFSPALSVIRPFLGDNDSIILSLSLITLGH